MSGVRHERTFWRDEGLSQRHRKWGWDCPMLDIDFLAVEFDKGEPVALVEYKNEYADVHYASHPSYQALIKLGNRAGLPVIACRYASDFSKWRVTALNGKAREIIPERTELDEAGWVSLLYKIRGREVSRDVLENMNIEI